MLIPPISRRRIAIHHAGRAATDPRVILFVGLIVGLIIWTLWAPQVRGSAPGGWESGNTDSLGAQIVLAPNGNGVSDIIVNRIEPNSPADLAGLQIGDRILGIDGRLVTSFDMAQARIDAATAQKPLQLTIQRAQHSRNIDIRLPTQLLAAPDDKTASMPLSQRVILGLIFLKLTLLMFALLYKNIIDRVMIVLFFAGLTIFLGGFLGIYKPTDAFLAIKFNTLGLLLGMAIISVVLDICGFFDLLAYRIYRVAGLNQFKIFVCFILVTYGLSLLINNLTTILVIVPMTINLAGRMRFDPRPLIIGEVIASNLGGASTMVGDFPNMLIAAETGIGFGEFIIYMMPICLILLACLLIYLYRVAERPDDAPMEPGKTLKLVRPRISIKEKRAIRRALFILSHMIFLFIIAGLISLKPATVALFGGLSLFLFSGIDKRQIINKIGFGDILFFTGLFIVVGSLEASGLLQIVARAITAAAMGQPWLLCLILMWSAALLTAFLSAGPTTALFFPVVLSLGCLPPHHIIWWALSLGVLAGSSATLTGATAGPVATTLLEKYCARARIQLSGGNTIPFKAFIRTGLPVMAIFLSLSSVYVVGLCLSYR